MYDPVFGRFLSPDPHIQSPLNSQSLNRYSYVLNNPLSLTDPSGYFFSWFKKLFKKILKVIKKIIKKIVKIIKKVIKAIEKVITKIIMALPVEIRIIAAIVVAIYAPQIAGALLNAAPALTSGIINAIGYGAFKGAVGGFLAGLITTGSFTGALIGGVTGGAFGAIGSHFKNIGIQNQMAAGVSRYQGIANAGSNLLKNGLTRLQFATQSLAHGVVGGLNSKLSGGSFSKGILTGFLNKIASPIVSSTNSFVSLVRHTAFAGIVSKIAGGSFSQGARIGFMATLFNELGNGRGDKLWADTKKWFGEHFRFGDTVNLRAGGFGIELDHRSAKLSDYSSSEMTKNGKVINFSESRTKFAVEAFGTGFEFENTYDASGNLISRDLNYRFFYYDINAQAFTIDISIGLGLSFDYKIPIYDPIEPAY